MQSHSIHAAQSFLAAHRQQHPEDDIEKIDLWNVVLPPFDGETIEVKFAVLRKNQFTAEQKAKWQSLQAVSRRFNAADEYVFSVPMWNSSIPYPLRVARD